MVQKPLESPQKGIKKKQLLANDSPRILQVWGQSKASCAICIHKRIEAWSCHASWKHERVACGDIGIMASRRNCHLCNPRNHYSQDKNGDMCFLIVKKKKLVTRLALESGPPLIWSKHMLILQLLSKNFERECPMVRFIKLIACRTRQPLGVQDNVEPSRFNTLWRGDRS